MSSARNLWLLRALVGPGIISMLANNDAGGLISYAVTGATFGIGLFLPLLFVIAPLGYSFQEMSMRLSAVTCTEYQELLRRHFGRVSACSSVSVLTMTNLLYMVIEFAGMTAGLTFVGLPIWAGDVLSLVFVSAVTLLLGHRRKERFILLIGAVNTVFVVAAILSHPDPVAIQRAFTSWPAISRGISPGTMLIFIAATIGNAVAPFMLYFQSSATFDKQLTAGEVGIGRADIALGAALQPFFAAAVMICGAGLVGRIVNLPGSAPRELISGLVPVTGRVGSDLFAIGLFNAGCLAAITISFSSAYAVAGSFSAKRSLSNRVAEAPGFYGLYIGSLLIGALANLIPELPLNMIAVFIQIIAAVLLVPDLIFLVLLTSNRGLMGDHVNRSWQRIMGWTFIALYAAISVVFVYILL